MVHSPSGAATLKAGAPGVPGGILGTCAGPAGLGVRGQRSQEPVLCLVSPRASCLPAPASRHDVARMRANSVSVDDGNPDAVMPVPLVLGCVARHMATYHDSDGLGMYTAIADRVRGSAAPMLPALLLTAGGLDFSATAAEPRWRLVLVQPPLASTPVPCMTPLRAAGLLGISLGKLVVGARARADDGPDQQGSGNAFSSAQGILLFVLLSLLRFLMLRVAGLTPVLRAPAGSTLSCSLPARWDDSRALPPLLSAAACRSSSGARSAR